MALSIFAGLGVDIGVVGGIIFIVFFTLFIISRLLCLIKKYRINCKVKRQVLPRRNVNTRARTTVATHLSQAIVPEPREPPKTTNAATGASISASTYHESERVEKCVSCVCPLQKGDMVLRLPACDHLLHDFCIGPWFFVNSICPGCGEKVNGQFTVRVGNGRTV